MSTLRAFFHRWGIPEEIAVDGASNLSSSEFTDFLRRWSVHRRLSSAYFPQSNGRAEAAVKSMKWLIRGHTGARGSLDTDAITLALLQYRNTPLQNAGGKSPAQLALGRELKDSIPLPKHRYLISHHWKDYLRNRENLMAVNNQHIVEKWNKSAKPLQRITHRAEVFCQNPKTKTWDRSGRVVECLPYRQYKIKIDGTGRITLRNRRHIRQRYSGTMLTQNTTDDTPTSSTPTHSTSTSDDNSISLTSNPSGQRVAHSDTNQDVSIIIPRRSGRTRRQPLRFRDYEMND